MKIDGIKVVDAKKPLTLHITTTDVKKGNNKAPASCAAAQCAMRLPGVTAARVHVANTYIRVGDKWLRFYTPGALRTEIVAFDRGGTFAPGDYTLKPVPERQRLGSGTNSGSNTSRNGSQKAKKRTRKNHMLTGVRPRGAR